MNVYFIYCLFYLSILFVESYTYQYFHFYPHSFPFALKHTLTPESTASMLAFILPQFTISCYYLSNYFINYIMLKYRLILLDHLFYFITISYDKPFIWLKFNNLKKQLSFVLNAVAKKADYKIQCCFRFNAT